MIYLIIYFLYILIIRKRIDHSKLYCGLVGFSSSNYLFSKEKIAMLMFHNQERGKDSTGLYSPLNGVKKSLLKAEDYIANSFYSEVEEDDIFIGHVRASTYGLTNLKNAHPFHEGNIVLAHNGTLDLPWNLCTNMGLSSAAYDVDSHVLAASLNKEQNLKVLSKFEGSAAILFTDTNNPDYLYAYRNKERPLYRGITDEGMYISSTDKSLKMIGCKDIKEFKEDFFYIIKNGKIERYFKIKKNPFPKISTYTNNRNNVDYTIREAENHNGAIIPIHKATMLGIPIMHKYIQSDADYYVANNKPCKITKNKWYFVENIDMYSATTGQTDRFFIKDDEGNTVSVKWWNFYRESVKDYTKLKYFVLTSNIVYCDGSSKGKHAGSRNEIVKVKVPYKEGDEIIEILSLDGKRSVSISLNYVRPLDSTEEKTLNNQKIMDMEEFEKLKNNFETKIKIISDKIKDSDINKNNTTQHDPTYLLSNNEVSSLYKDIVLLSDEFKQQCENIYKQNKELILSK